MDVCVITIIALFSSVHLTIVRQGAAGAWSDAREGVGGGTRIGMGLGFGKMLWVWLFVAWVLWIFPKL